MKRWVVAATIAFTAVGCSPSAPGPGLLPPEAVAHVRGLLSDEQGAPLVSMPFAVCRGSTCDGPEASAPFVEGVTDDQGFFSFDVRGDQTVVSSTTRVEGTVWQAASFAITLPHTGEQTTSTQFFTVQTTDLTLPELRRWNFDSHQTEGTDGSLEVDWTPSQAVAWSGDPVSVSADVPATHTASHAIFAATNREDFTPLHLGLTQYLTFGSSSQTHAFHTELKPGALMPVSRGAACTINGLAQVTCPFTTGRLDLPNALPANTTEVVVSLPQPTAVSRVVTQGLQVDGRLVVEVSSDGVAWAQVFVHNGSQSAIDRQLGDGAGASLHSSRPISQVRLRIEENFAVIKALKQLSLF